MVIILVILVARRKSNEVTIAITIALREKVAAIDRNGALNAWCAVIKGLGSSRYTILVHLEQMGSRVQIEARNAGRVVWLIPMVVFAEDEAISVC